MAAIEDLPAGCWQLCVSSAGPAGELFDGTLRVDSAAASGDLYARVRGAATPPPATVVPVFSRADYHAYLRVQGGRMTTDAVRIDFDNIALLSVQPPTWHGQRGLSAQLARATAPAGFPVADRYFEGPVVDPAGAAVGSMAIGWISPFLRRATVEIDCVQGVESPAGGHDGVSWQAVFEAVGWDLDVRASDCDVAEPQGGRWTDMELHESMLLRRERVDLDREWRYHLLCVRLLESGERGVMYDNGDTDSNSVAREGAVVAADWVFPDIPRWGRVRGMRFGAARAAYFRTALHEIGHAMGLMHNPEDAGIMNTSEAIADAAVAPEQFPDTVLWAYATIDARRLAHLPDAWVRPGAIAFSQRYLTPGADAPAA